MQKYLFIESDALIGQDQRPLQSGVVYALKQIQDGGYGFLFLINEKKENWDLAKAIFSGEGIVSKDVKANLEDILIELKEKDVDYTSSCWIGDLGRKSAAKLHVRYMAYEKTSWAEIAYELIQPRDRLALVHRRTKETDIRIELNLDGRGQSRIDTGIPFFDHMLAQIAKHGNVDLNIKVRGDLEIDEHHSVEDTAITLGQAMKKAIGDKRGIERYGFTLPMDESLASVALDFSGRPIVVYQADIRREKVGDFPVELVKHFWESLCQHAGLNLHMTLRGTNAHHMIEGGFKGFAKSLSQAVRREGKALPSTKGSL